MGLADLIVLGLCINNTCVDDNVTNIISVTSAREREQIKNKLFRIVTVQNPPLSYAEEINGKLVGKGISFDFINFLQEKHEFQYEVILPPEDSLDYEAKGIIGMLNRNEADIGAAFLPIFPRFRRYIRYSYSFDDGEWVVLMKRPPVSATGSGLLAPFTFQVWLLILLSLGVVGPIIYFIILLQARLCKDDDSKIYPLPSCIWFVYGALLKQGSTLSPKTDSSRLLFATWWLFITILTAFYTANLTAFLTLSLFTLPISKVDDIGIKKYSWVSHKGSAIEEALKQKTYFKNGLKGSHYEFLQENASSILENWVKRRDYMYIGEKPIVEHLMYREYLAKSNSSIPEAERCTYVITTWTVQKYLRAFAYSKEFQFQNLFDSTIRHLVESGIIKYKMGVGLPDTHICPLDLGSKERQLQNSDLLMTYYIVVGGFVVSTIIFIGELISVQLKSRKKGMPAFVANNRRKITGGNFNVKFNDIKENYKIHPPPPYHALFNPPFPHTPHGKTKNINGRDYWVVKSVDGTTSLIPVRTPSAFLFQYTN